MARPDRGTPGPAPLCVTVSEDVLSALVASLLFLKSSRVRGVCLLICAGLLYVTGPVISSERATPRAIVE